MFLWVTKVVYAQYFAESFRHFKEIDLVGQAELKSPVADRTSNKAHVALSSALFLLMP